MQSGTCASGFDAFLDTEGEAVQTLEALKHRLLVAASRQGQCRLRLALRGDEATSRCLLDYEDAP